MFNIYYRITEYIIVNHKSLYRGTTLGEPNYNNIL